MFRPHFIILDYSGPPFQISTKGVSVAKIPGYLDAAPAMIPIRNPEIFEGIATITPISNVIESEN